MITKHKILFQNSQNLRSIENDSIALVVTSPPYPMIEMWDEIFSNQNMNIKEALDNNDGNTAFDLMHIELSKVWKEMHRILIPGGTFCVNIGDATRKIGENFNLYSNHSRIIENCVSTGFSLLPGIIWRKPSNAPNKFMGSGMTPPNAYITLERENILVFRKGNIRRFKNPEEKKRRKESAYFWEERNIWFSDMWDLRGVSQIMVKNDSRERNASFPIELPYRLINMFSIKKDTILDPFLGLGTTTLAAMASGRNSIGIEIDSNIINTIIGRIDKVKDKSNKLIENRIKNHIEFIENRVNSGKEIKHHNIKYDFPVVTSMEKTLILNKIKSISKTKELEFEVLYEE